MEIRNQEANHLDAKESYDNMTKLGIMTAQLDMETACCGNSSITWENNSEVLGDSKENFYSEIGIAEPETETQVVKDIFPQEAYMLMTENRDNRDLIIVDVCTPKEYAKLHLENAINLNFFSTTFKDQLNALDRNKTYLVYCKVGGRSKMAQKIMKKIGFREIYNIVGGTILWEEEGLPFASGMESSSRFALCPISILLTLMIRLKKFFQKGYQYFVNMVRKPGLLRKDLL
jgi:rhodanese-related sulfurtransferase